MSHPASSSLGYTKSTSHCSGVAPDLKKTSLTGPVSAGPALFPGAADDEAAGELPPPEAAGELPAPPGEEEGEASPEHAAIIEAAISTINMAAISLVPGLFFKFVSS